MGILLVCVSVYHVVPGAWRGQRGHQILGLKMVGSHHVVLWKSIQCHVSSLPTVPSKSLPPNTINLGIKALMHGSLADIHHTQTIVPLSSNFVIV